MLTYRELVALARTLRDECVLSVYVDGRVSDPAARDQWRHRVDADLRALRATAAASPAGCEPFDRAAAHLLRHLPPVGQAVGARGWVGFVTAGGVAHHAALAVPPPSRMAWTVGPCVAPYVRALEQLRPVIVAVVDAVHARLYRYRNGTIEALEALWAERSERPPSHMGSMPRVGFHTGTRGAPGVDEAERRRLGALGHLASAVAARLAVLAGADGWVVIGGTPEAARVVRQALPIAVSRRATTLPALHDGASEAEIAQAAARGASALRNVRDVAAVAELLECAGGGGRAAVGLEATRRTLGERAVRTVYFTQAFLERDADAVEAVVRDALAQHAAVEEVSGVAAERLDRDGGGIAARLRFGRGGGPEPVPGAATRPLPTVRVPWSSPARTHAVARAPAELAHALVVCAASAGGIPALERVLSTLPASFPAAVAIVLHRSPARPSILAALLARRTPLRVVQVDAAVGQIHAGTVYLAPPDRHLVVTADRAFDAIDGRRIRHVRSSANPLLDSAAQVYGDRLVAVVLTGSDSDATDGVQAVKAGGGTVIAQDPATALVGAMPHAAIASGAVDEVLPLEEIGPALVRLVSQYAAPGDA